MIPASLQTALDRTRIPVKERYTGDELMELMAATADLENRPVDTKKQTSVMTQRQIAEFMGIKRYQVDWIERAAIMKIRRSGILDDIL